MAGFEAGRKGVEKEEMALVVVEASLASLSERSCSRVSIRFVNVSFGSRRLMFSAQVGVLFDDEFF